MTELLYPEFSLPPADECVVFAAGAAVELAVVAVGLEKLASGEWQDAALLAGAYWLGSTALKQRYGYSAQEKAEEKRGIAFADNFPGVTAADRLQGRLIGAAFKLAEGAKIAAILPLAGTSFYKKNRENIK